MKVLFIGGTGVLSSSCSELALQNGIDLFHLNRGLSKSTAELKGVSLIQADIRNYEATAQALKNYSFDVVVDFIALEPNHIQTDLNLFRDKTSQYMFISTVCVYTTPPVKLPITEDEKQGNPFWDYAQKKIACEVLLKQQAPAIKLPYTIVRPSHTYNQTKIPLRGDYTALHRIKTGQSVFIHDDGNAIWPLTHARDFAKGLVGLLGNQAAIGEAFHITTDELITWNQIYKTMADALGVELKAVYVPTEDIAKLDKVLGEGLLGDKAYSKVFDTSKIKRAIPDFKCITTFEQGAREIVEWYANNSSKQVIDVRMNDLFDRLVQ